MPNLIYATEDDLKGQGFPELFQTAFLNTANEMDSVVMSRTPGKAGTKIIEENYDLKSFLVHAKSCNWGPMQGFLCQVPILNKKGLQGIEYNTHEMLLYFETFEDRGNPPSEVTVGTPELSLPDRIKGILESAGLKAENFRSPESWDRLPKQSIEELRQLLGFSNESIYNQILKRGADKATKLKLDAALQDLRQLIGPKSPFVPLKISAERWTDIQNHESMGEYRISLGQDFYGIAFHSWPDSEEIDIVMDYLIRRVKFIEGLLEPYYELYFGEVRYKEYELDQEDKFKLKTDGQWKPFPGNTDFSTLFPKLKKATSENNNLKEITMIKNEITAWKNASERPLLFPNEKLEPLTLTQKNQNSITVVREEFCKAKGLPVELFGNKPEGEMYPIQGLQNYYPPYTGDDSYKNAVTGDYDLFAIWPKKQLNTLVRQSEERTKADAALAFESGAPLFCKVAEKVFTLQSTVSPSIYIEFIPDFGEIAKMEHKSFGNYNNLGTKCAGMLNSFVTLARAKLGLKTSPNAAFHSDEGGRPGIDDVEYPVAVFLPSNIATELDPTTKKQRLLLDNPNHIKFLDLILALKDKCLIPLNFVWLHDMLIYAYRADKQDANDVKLKLVTLFAGNENRLLELKNGFDEIFSKAHKGKKSAEKIDYILDGLWTV